MDIDTVDREYQLLQQEAQQLSQALEGLANKLQTAATGGNTDAKEWLLDLKEVALQIQQEQLQMQSVLQALHGFAVNSVQQPPAPTTVLQPVQAVPAAAPAQGGGGLSHFLSGTFGQSMVSGAGMGVGFGLTEGLIGSLFGN